jgi:hypothetical protein
MGAMLSNVFPVCDSSMMARLQFISLWTAAKHRQGWKKTRVLKKNQPSGFFLGFFFFCFFVFLGFLYICPEESRLFRVFSVSRILLGASRL